MHILQSFECHFVAWSEKGILQIAIVHNRQVAHSEHSKGCEPTSNYTCKLYCLVTLRFLGILVRFRFGLVSTPT